MKWLLFLALLFVSCKKKNATVFELLDNKSIGVDFENTVNNTEDFNIFTYRNFYNGGGVAIGDINNDGLPDVYFTANMGKNKLYLNKGNFQFEDITDKAGVAVATKWSTGVEMVDINADGLLDIYVCNAGYQKNIGQENELYINNGDLTFTESAAKYGLDEDGYTTHASFFDYDLDGDLDCYILNNSFIPVNTLNNDNNRTLRAKDWPVKDFLKGGGDKLLRNDKGKFVDVSEQTGIYGSLIGFGLGVTVGDINQDNYPDIYISNDFYERDYLYINQKNGTFKEELELRFGHTSFASMGADMADLNNDGYQEIFVTDMLPREEIRLKTTTAFDNHYVSKLRTQKGFYYQYMQNSLQLNNQDGTFSEIAYFANVASSDWSWGALLFDADNDLNTDIYVSNGILHDVIDQDFIDFFANELNQKMVLSGEKEKFDNILNNIPSKPQINYFFKNNGNLKFEDKSADFGFDTPSFSNGAAYADLDNDGDLDLVVNNVNQQCFFYKNNTENSNNHNLKIKLKGAGENTFAIGAKVDVYVNDKILSKQLFPARGFQSSVEYPLIFGVGEHKIIDSLKITWPNNTENIVFKLKTDSVYSFDLNNGKSKIKANETSFTKTLLKENPFMAFEKHVEDDYDDFYYEKNIPQSLAKEGPKMAIGDVNGDGTSDVFICGGKNQVSQMYFQQNGKFILSKQGDFTRFSLFEDTAAQLFDADNDGDLDLFVGSGGNEYKMGDRLLMARLYLNDGKGKFKISGKSLPNSTLNTSVIVPLDFDSDGDLDLFIGARNYPHEYGYSPNSFVYENDGKGFFKDVTLKVAKKISQIGMVRDACYDDIDGDNKKELIIVGDWMSPKIIKIDNKKFILATNDLNKLNGFWGSVKTVDIDNDNDLDLVLGNIGENFSLYPDSNNPMRIRVGDFDKNGLNDKVLTKTVNQKEVPVFLKREMMEQFPFLKAQNLKHSAYATKTIFDLFKADILEQGYTAKIDYLSSIVAINDGKGIFLIKKLPMQAQFSSVNAIEKIDINKDGFQDLVIGGNNYGFIPQFSRQDASKGLILLNNKKGNFYAVNYTKAGLNLQGETRQISGIQIGDSKMIIALINNQSPKVFGINE